jgi:hypothetical protein
MNKLISKTSIKIPNVLHVVRKKSLLRNDDYWSKSQRDRDNYYSSILEDKLYLYSFLNNQSVQRCYSFLQKYNNIHGQYPSTSESVKPTIFDENSDIYIDSDTRYSLEHRCLLNNLGLMGITTFEYTYCETFLERKNVFNLTVSGIDLLEGQENDNVTQVNHLTYILRL